MAQPCFASIANNSPTLTTASVTTPLHHQTAAKDASLYTTELLESILKFLDVKTLLLAQGVSRQFRDVITDSLPLQQKLFLAPATLEEALSTADGEDDDLHNWLGPDQTQHVSVEVSASDSLGYKPFYMTNSALLEIADPEHRTMSPPPDKWTTYLTSDQLLQDQTQSFLGMYLSHPMSAYIRFELCIGTLTGASIMIPFSIRGWDEDGPRTFGKLLKAVEQKVETDLTDTLRSLGGIVWQRSRISTSSKKVKLHEARARMTG